MKKTILALAVALFCTTAATQAQAPRRGDYNNGYNTRSYGDDRDPWHDGHRAYDRRQYNRNWVVVAPRGRRNRPVQGHWVYVPRTPQRYYAAPPPPPCRYPARRGYAYGRRW